MPKVRDIRKLGKYIKDSHSAFVRGYSKAFLESLTVAENEAKKNVTKNFTGRHGRKLSGRLLNSIFTSIEISSDDLPRGFIGTQGIPYGAVHEFGDTIRPKKAKHLWQKLHGKNTRKYRRMTPREFMTMRNSNKGRKEKFSIFRSKKGNLIAAVTQRIKNKNKITPLFWLRDEVTIPPRPYLGPAVAVAFKGFIFKASKRFAQEMIKVK